MDAEASIKADAKFKKGYYRKCSALFGLSKFKEAKKALQVITKTLKVKNNKDVNKKIKAITDFIRQKAFFECIEYEDEYKKCKPEELIVGPDYKGPRLEVDTQLDQKWVEDLLEYMKNQKRVHKKYIWIIIKRLIDILDAEPNIPSIDFSEMKQISVCGDVHG